MLGFSFIEIHHAKKQSQSQAKKIMNDSDQSKPGVIDKMKSLAKETCLHYQRLSMFFPFSSPL